MLFVPPAGFERKGAHFGTDARRDHILNWSDASVMIGRDRVGRKRADSRATGEAIHTAIRLAELLDFRALLIVHARRFFEVLS